MINFEYTRVSSVKAAVDALAKNPTGGFIAGGTNLVPQPGSLISTTCL
jgi:CO/xanthine dehydrogenase FAD-binding subunit